MSLSSALTIPHSMLVGRRRRVLALTTRVALLSAGSVVIAACVAVMLWNDLGAGPLDVFIGALRVHTGLPLALAIWITIGSLTLLAWGLGRRPGLGTVLGPIVVGPTMQWVLGWLDQFEPSHNIVVRVVVQLLAIGAIGFGAGAVYASGLGQGTGELLASAASERSGRSEPSTRMVVEITYLVVGVLLGGPIGIGTVLVALCIGPSVARGRRSVGAGVDASRRRVVASARC